MERSARPAMALPLPDMLQDEPSNRGEASIFAASRVQSQYLDVTVSFAGHLSDLLDDSRLEALITALVSQSFFISPREPPVPWEELSLRTLLAPSQPDSGLDEGN